MTDRFIARVDALCEGLKLLSPRDAERRGSQVCYSHPQAYAVTQALIERGVIGDFREPDVLRFGFAPLYLRHADVEMAATTLADVLSSGGWRAEQATNGYEYYRYKGSDVGPRVIRHVVSGPVWIAPASTPIRTLVKGKTINGRWESIVNYDELGPGFLSAYGLVAGYFVVPGQNGRSDFDNGVRAHGSSDYLSISPITMSSEPTMAGISAIRQLAHSGAVTDKLQNDELLARARSGMLESLPIT